MTERATTAHGERREARLDAARSELGIPGASEDELLEQLMSVPERELGVDLGFLAAELATEHDRPEAARAFYASIGQRVSAKASARQRATVGALDERLRRRLTVWTVAGIAGLAVLALALVFGGCLILWSWLMARPELGTSGQLDIVRWLSDTQTVELYQAAGEREVGLGAAESCSGDGGGGAGGSCGPGGGVSLRDRRGMLRALMNGGRRPPATPPGGRPGGGAPGQREGDVFGVPGLGPPPLPLPPPPPTPPDPPEEITLAAPRPTTDERREVRSCSAVERACEGAQIPASDVQTSPSVARAMRAAIAGLRQDGDCEGLDAAIQSGRRGAAWRLDPFTKSFAERHAAWCYLERAERVEGDARTAALEAAQLRAERSACAEPNEAWRAYLLMVSGAMEREALPDAAGYLGCARSSVAAYAEVSEHPLDLAEAWLNLSAWEWSVMGNAAGFRAAQAEAQAVLEAIGAPPDPAADDPASDQAASDQAASDEAVAVDPDEVARMAALVDANWLEFYALGDPSDSASDSARSETEDAAAAFDIVLRRLLSRPQVDERLYLVVSAVEVVHLMLRREDASAQARLRALIERYGQAREFHPDWVWAGLERRVAADPRFAGTERARRVLVITQVFTGAQTPEKVQQLHGVSRWLGERAASSSSGPRGNGGSP